MLKNEVPKSKTILIFSTQIGTNQKARICETQTNVINTGKMKHRLLLSSNRGTPMIFQNPIDVMRALSAIADMYLRNVSSIQLNRQYFVDV